jgi:hypothetical protein
MGVMRNGRAVDWDNPLLGRGHSANCPKTTLMTLSGSRQTELLIFLGGVIVVRGG